MPLSDAWRVMGRSGYEKNTVTCPLCDKTYEVAWGDSKTITVQDGDDKVTACFGCIIRIIKWAAKASMREVMGSDEWKQRRGLGKRLESAIENETDKKLPQADEPIIR